jgi:hypothetical protein
MMNSNKKSLLVLILFVILPIISSCSPDLSSEKVDSEKSPAISSTPSKKQPAANLRDKPAKAIAPQTKQPTKSLAANSQAATNKTIPVTLYTSDLQCQELLPQKTVVSAEEPITSAIGKILEQRDSSDFSLSGYRINVQNGVATVDLRVSPESKRQLASLSSCEQFALFGSVRKTLTSNSQWKIKEVRFTERGKEVVL